MWVDWLLFGWLPPWPECHENWRDTWDQLWPERKGRCWKAPPSLRHVAFPGTQFAKRILETFQNQIQYPMEEGMERLTPSFGMGKVLLHEFRFGPEPPGQFHPETITQGHSGQNHCTSKKGIELEINWFMQREEEFIIRRGWEFTLNIRPVLFPCFLCQRGWKESHCLSPRSCKDAWNC